MTEAPNPDYKRVELVWPGKKTQVERVKLPFQVIERINDVRRSERGQGHLLGTDLPLEWPNTWRNKLIWGDNKSVLASLLDDLAGRVDLIYIDPPFEIGANFSYRARIGEDENALEVVKEPTILEERAYRDTWGEGVDSYLHMLQERLILARELLSPEGTIYVHLGPNIVHYVKVLMDETFGRAHFLNQIIWQRQTAHSDIGQGAQHLGRLHDVLLLYTKSDSYRWNMQYTPYDESYANAFYKHVEPETGRRYRLSDTTAPGGAAKGNPHYEFLGVRRYWRFSEERMWQLYREGRIVQTRPGTVPAQKRYLDEMQGVPLQDMWDDVRPVQPQAGERTGYDTQKPEALLERIIKLSSNPGDLIVDFFCGSGTTMVVAERLGRRWIGCDLGRFAIQTSRKRLLDMRAKPFEVLNLGRYERRYWQGATAGEAIGDYYRFIIELFHGEIIPGFAHLHGIKHEQKVTSLIHVGATDAPVTERELRSALEECKANGFTELDVLGWEWEMGLNGEGADRLGREHNVKVRLFNIPREVMDKRAIDAGDVHFFELSVADLEAHLSKNEAVIELSSFLPAIDDYMRRKVGDAALKWSDWIDYWSVDFEYDGETFINQWQAYRTRKNRALTLRSDPHIYDKPGEYTVVVKVIDIFGNDTTQQLKVTVG